MFLIHDFHLSKGPNKPYIKNNNKKKKSNVPLSSQIQTWLLPARWIKESNITCQTKWSRFKCLKKQHIMPQFKETAEKQSHQFEKGYKSFLRFLDSSKPWWQPLSTNEENSGEASVAGLLKIFQDYINNSSRRS